MKSERFRIIGPDGYAIHLVEATAPKVKDPYPVFFYYREPTKYFVHMYVAPTPDAIAAGRSGRFEIYTKEHALGLLSPTECDPGSAVGKISEKEKSNRRDFFYYSHGYSGDPAGADQRLRIPVEEVPNVVSVEAVGRIRQMFPGIFEDKLMQEVKVFL